MQRKRKMQLNSSPIIFYDCVGQTPPALPRTLPWITHVNSSSVTISVYLACSIFFLSIFQVVTCLYILPYVDIFFSPTHLFLLPPPTTASLPNTLPPFVVSRSVEPPRPFLFLFNGQHTDFKQHILNHIKIKQQSPSTEHEVDLASLAGLCLLGMLLLRRGQHAKLHARRRYVVHPPALVHSRQFGHSDTAFQPTHCPRSSVPVSLLVMVLRKERN